MTAAHLKPNFPIDMMSSRLLAGLDDADRALLLPHLEPVHLTVGDVLMRPDRNVSYAYFPCAGALVLLFITMVDSRAAQAAAVTNLGVVGLLDAMGDGCGLNQAVVAIGGEALRIHDAELNQAIQRSPGLRDYLMRYTEALMGELTQNAACNALHSVDKRVARWLLTAHDCCVHDADAMYAGGVTLPIKQESLSEALGVQRTTVTLAAKRLQESGCLRYTRGRIRVIDRTALEDAACECHGRVWQLWRRLLPEAVEAWRPGA